MLQVACSALCQREVRAVIAEPEARVPGVASVDARSPLGGRRVPRAPPRTPRRARRRRGRDLHPRARQGRPRRSSASASRRSTAPSTRSATRAHPFTIQSMSKPLTYGLALERLRHDAVHAPRRRRAERRRVQRDQPPPRARERRCNPMINAGRDRLRRARRRGAPTTRSTLLLATYSALRRPAARDRRGASTAPRRETGHRNRAIAHLLRNFDVLDRRRRRPRSTSTSASARSRSTAATSRRSRRRSRTAASTRSRASARVREERRARASSA